MKERVIDIRDERWVVTATVTDGTDTWEEEMSYDLLCDLWQDIRSLREFGYIDLEDEETTDFDREDEGGPDYE